MTIPISIIIPCFNQQEYVADSIESALDQTVNCEIIFINDGSQDHSLDIAKKYPIRIIDQVNKGLASARNTGIMWARGDFILPLDSDDMLMSNCVERLEQITKETDADVVAASFKNFGINNQEIILMPEPKLEDFKTGNRIGYCAAIRKKALLEVGGYSPRMAEGYEDLHLWFNLLTRGAKIVTIPEVLWLYRTKEKSMYTTAVQHHEKLMDQIKKDFKF